MDVKRLRILREFADRGSVGTVAVALHMTPSAVSQQLKLLAAEAGIELLEPVGRGLRLTPAGRALVLRADDVVAAVDRATEEMRAYRGGRAGALRIASFPSGAALLAPTAVRSLSDDGIEVMIADLDVAYGDAPRALVDHDLVVTHRDERMPPVTDPRVRRVELMREPIDVVVPRGGALAQRPSVRPHDLADSSWISVPEGFPVDDVLLSVAAATGVVPRVTQRIVDFAVIQALVAADQGIALLPRHCVGHPGVTRLTLDGVRAARVVEVLTRPDTRGRPLVERGVRALRRAADAAVEGTGPVSANPARAPRGSGSTR
ncbi:LysR family transcriptional regulator [Williamsia sterculiae]|uniref:DNA-binding transcriptional regulator, LysR family n=1 Tax=Williamsia sterculiae TaxID=1344003 RepID=A0A1N7F689_9NOCA|nr:LysR family transcriptional regulator [Williamsia sterculiae]SIR95772.1 DNA-binding transcriptional regulator, LysR family [Williamsia sterculiae]